MDIGSLKDYKYVAENGRVLIHNEKVEHSYPTYVQYSSRNRGALHYEIYKHSDGKKEPGDGSYVANKFYCEFHVESQAYCRAYWDGCFDKLSKLEVVRVPWGEVDGVKCHYAIRLKKFFEGFDSNLPADVLCRKLKDAIAETFDVLEPEIVKYERKVNLERTEKMVKEQMGRIMDLLKSNCNVILTGAPGTGKTFLARQIAQQMTLGRVVNDEVELTEDEKRDLRERSSLVQFHPGYDYSDFVVGLKPVLVDEHGKEIKGTSTDGKVSVTYKWKDGVFKQFAQEVVRVDPEKKNKYVLVIDEINRADLSRVFGELFSAIEPDYRDKEIELPSGGKFSVPANLYIIGTMNDIDRSVDSMDFALRRRFAWYEVRAKDSECIIDAKVSDKNLAERLKEAMRSINDCISSGKVTVGSRELSLGLGSEYELGGAIFANAEKYKDAADVASKLWGNHIKVILSEYLRGNREKTAILNALEAEYKNKIGLQA